jgi:hypothetical protein
MFYLVKFSHYVVNLVKGILDRARFQAVRSLNIDMGGAVKDTCGLRSSPSPLLLDVHQSETSMKGRFVPGQNVLPIKLYGKAIDSTLEVRI